jgi:hypothetical protein
VNPSGMKVSLVPKYSLLIFLQVGLANRNGIIVKYLDSYKVLSVTVVNAGVAKYDYQNILRGHVLVNFLEPVAQF